MTNHHVIAGKAREFPGWHVSPAGATHWAPETNNYSECWYMNRNGKWFFMRAVNGGHEWLPHTNKPTKYRCGQMLKRIMK